MVEKQSQAQGHGIMELQGGGRSSSRSHLKEVSERYHLLITGPSLRNMEVCYLIKLQLTSLNIIRKRLSFYFVEEETEP